MRSAMALGAATLAASLTLGGEAAADRGDGEAVAGFALVVGAGIASSVGSQVSLIRGEPDATWGGISLGAAGANATLGTLLLLLGHYAPHSDERLGYSVAGGVMLAISGACLVSGAVTLAAAKPEQKVGAAPGGLGIRMAF